jgi:hypothetical protein
MKRILVGLAALAVLVLLSRWLRVCMLSDKSGLSKVSTTFSPNGGHRTQPA